MLAYRVPTTVSWGQLFSLMEALKAGRDPADHHHEQKQGQGGRATTSNTSSSPFSTSSRSIVEVYAASDTSLEQVFLSFAREAQTEALDGAVVGGAPPVSQDTRSHIIVTEL